MGLINAKACISLLGVFIGTSSLVAAQPAPLTFDDCSSGSSLNASQRIQVSTVYGQILHNTTSNTNYLNLTVIGETGTEIIPYSPDTGLLATLFTTSTVLTFNLLDARSPFCSTLRPASPLPTLDPNSTTGYCPLSPGPIAFSATVPLGRSNHELFTIDTQLRVVDTSSPAVELACINVYATRIVQGPIGDSTYGHVTVLFWFTVGLAISYWIVVGLARMVGAWGRGGSGGRGSRGIMSSIEGAGLILASAISGERFAHSPALLRYGSPSMRDVIFHTQWCAAITMVAVQWPIFIYPFAAQTAWTTLSYNITLSQGSNGSQEHWNPLSVPPYNPPSSFADQLADSSSPIFIESSSPNTLLMFPTDTPTGIPSFAAAVGLRPQDLFGICLSLFLAIMAGTIAISLVIWAFDWLLATLFGRRDGSSPFGSPAYTPASKDATDKPLPSSADYEGSANGHHFLSRVASIPLPSVLGLRGHWKVRIRPNSFHGSVLHGNLVRILILFHLPVTIFSCYQFTLGRSNASLVSVILAVLSFAAFSVVIPVFLIVRLTITATSKLYDETRTLLMLGPLYNHYAHGSQLFACLFFATNLAYGITIGCGQKSGTVQAIVLLVIEVISALGTSIWLPWGKGAGMGLISFFMCVARIAVAVLLVILAPVVSVGFQAAGWVSVAVLFITGLIYLGFFLILIIKVVEGLIRIVAQIPFDRSRHTVDSGLLGVLAMLGCCGPKRRRRRRRESRVLQNNNPSRNSQQALQRDGTPRSSNLDTPSVLRSDVAKRSYRDDSDDESGFIMGAWQPFPRPGYSPVHDVPQTPPAEPPKSGFSRVGGGRAHYDSPYAITSSPKPTTPTQSNLNRVAPSTTSVTSFPSLPQNDAGPSNVNASTYSIQTNTGLPPGAMPPTPPIGHIRKRSQTAIIEHASALSNPPVTAVNLNSSTEAERRSDHLPFSPLDADGDQDQNEPEAQPKRKNWFNLRKNRRFSEGAETAISPDIGSGNGRSFVVVRDKRPASRSDVIGQSTSEGGGERSFVVVRNNRTSEPSGEAGAGSSSRPPTIPPRSPRRLSHT